MSCHLRPLDQGFPHPQSFSSQGSYRAGILDGSAELESWEDPGPRGRPAHHDRARSWGRPEEATLADMWPQCWWVTQRQSYCLALGT